MVPPEGTRHRAIDDVPMLNVRRSQPFEPGLAKVGGGIERYRVAGGGAIVVALEAGDACRLVDVEGRQPCEVIVVAPDGREDAAALGLAAEIDPTGIKAILSSGGDDAQSVLAGLKRRGIDLGAVKASRFFGGDSPAGDAVGLTAERPAVLIVAAPGAPMPVDAHDPPTEIAVTIERAGPPPAEAYFLPEPLADPRLDFQIDRCTAQSYLVREGEYIQIVDLGGRQCSDFLAFTRRALDKGVERGLDSTTTRTLMGAAYPGPGLFSKFYDQDQQPLVEVVRDTAGRHDTFGLACSAKYYEDMGYPGHVNCSENLSNALVDHGVERRIGWPAINFFFNTRIDDHNVLYLDESWSRPGDYVLLRAMTDLVCASSGCPDDIDAANGWNPTDVQVRVYPRENLFSKAIAFRMTTESEATLTKETAFHPRIAEETRNFTEYRGYWLPTSFPKHGAIEEYWACREQAAVMDLSPLRKFEVIGPDAETLMHTALTRNVRRLSVGQVVYSAMCYEHGGMVDDGTLFRLGDDNFRWIGGDEFGGVWLRQLAERLGLKVWIKSSTDHLHNIAVQGPNSRDILKDFIWTPPTQPSMDELGWFRFTVGRVGRHDGIPLVVSRTGYTGELGYEIWCHPKDGPALWDALWEAGRPRGLAPLGLDALDMLRIEAGLIFYGYEFCEQTDPFEAGIGFSVALKSKADDDFVGKAALTRRKEHPQKVLVGLELDGNEPAAHGDCVHVGRPQIGEITSATRSPVLKKNIALCRIDVTHAALGTEVEVGQVDGHQKRIAAKVVPFPFYDPEKLRVRA